MNTETILAVVFSAVAAVAAIISLVVTLARRKNAGAASPADVENANRRLETSLAQRIEYTKTAMLDASAQGTRGSAGMRMMSPVSATRKPAPAASSKSRTETVKPFGLPSFAGSSEIEFCVFAMQTIRRDAPARSSSSSFLRAFGENETPSAP